MSLPICPVCGDGELCPRCGSCMNMSCVENTGFCPDPSPATAEERARWDA